MKKRNLDHLPDDHPDVVAERQGQIRKHSRSITSWMSTGIVLLAMNIFFSGGITWARYPIFFFVILIVSEFIKMWQLKQEQKRYEERGRPPVLRAPTMESIKPAQEEYTPDYSDTLLDQQASERELADLAEVRKLKRPWKDEDLV